MIRKMKTAGIVIALFTSQIGMAETVRKSTLELKQEILALAKSYEGQGDPDQSKQKTLEPLVEELVRQNPMAPIGERIPILAGVWKQVFGPYEYRNDDGSIDETLGIFEIYQVVFADGYYYNVAPYYPGGDKSKEQVGLLRGEFQLNAVNPNALNVAFTKYPGVDPRPAGVNIWDLAAQAEAGTLQNEITIVPTWVVKLFFRGGTLEEVYTDSDLRIAYGQSEKRGARRSLYVMSRIR